MTRWERFRWASFFALGTFFLQLFFLVFHLQFIDPGTGQFRLGAQFRFKFVDETTRQFVLVSELEKLPGELLSALEISTFLWIGAYVGLTILERLRPDVIRKLVALSTGAETEDLAPPAEEVLKRALDSGRMGKGRDSLSR